MTAILAPRFLASAFASGPSLLILLALILRKFTKFDAGKEAIQKLADDRHLRHGDQPVLRAGGAVHRSSTATCRTTCIRSSTCSSASTARTRWRPGCGSSQLLDASAAWCCC